MRESEGTIHQRLRAHARLTPDRRAFVFREPRGDTQLSWIELDQLAGDAASRLSEHCEPGSRVLMASPRCIDSVVGFFACAYASMTPVFTYPLKEDSTPWHHRAVERVVEDSGCSVAIAGSDRSDRGRDLLGSIPMIDALSSAPALRPYALEDETARPPAFLQYTSGSTTAPRGVVVEHERLMANLRDLQTAFAIGPSDIIVSWLPIHHDMGLVWGVLESVFAGATAVISSPQSFARDPLSWLHTLSTYKGTATAAPNFAYDLCSRRAAKAGYEHLDLSRWRIAINGAEPVRSSTMELFARRFHRCGFDRSAFRPSFGLAEATLLVSGRLAENAPQEILLDRALLERGEAGPSPGPDGYSVVGCGQPVPPTEIVVVDSETGAEARSGKIGEIYVRGPGVASRYWEDAGASDDRFGLTVEGRSEEDFLRTGDVGFIHAGALFVVGRADDMILYQGRNLHPEDLEASLVDVHRVLRRGNVAIVRSETAACEVGMTVVHEVSSRDPDALNAAARAIQGRLSAVHAVGPVAIVFVPRRGLPKTTSGKIKRHACARALASAELEILWPTRTRPARGRERRDASEIESWLIGRISLELDVSPDRLDRCESLSSFGLSSLATCQLIESLSRHVEMRLEETLVFDHPTIAEIAEHVAGRSASLMDP